jgi:FkbM family methyltransferase
MNSSASRNPGQSSYLRKAQLKLRKHLRYGIRDGFTEQANLLSKVGVKTVFDVGANRGRTVAKYASLFPNATVYAFEPTPAVYAELSEKFKSTPNVQTHPLAVGEADGETTFYVSNAHPDMNSVFEPNDLNWMGTVASTTVNMISLDSFCSARNIPEIHILKIDIQGGEIAALQGAANLLSNGAIWSIYVECQIRPLYEHQPLIYDILARMHGYGYTLYNFYNISETESGQANWCDALFISPKMSSLLLS